MSRQRVMELVAGSVLLASPALAVDQEANAGVERISACSLVPKDEVRKHFPWDPMFDQMPLEEEPIGSAGSSCSFPGLHVQIMSSSPRTLETIRNKAGVQAVGGLGDEAYLHNNANRYAELFVKVGSRLLTLQAQFEGDLAAVKPKLAGLAEAYVARLR